LCREAHKFISMCATSLLEVSRLTFKLHCSFSGRQTSAALSRRERTQFWLCWPSRSAQRMELFFSVVERNLQQIWSLACCICHCIWRTVYGCYAPDCVHPRPLSTKQLMYTTDNILSMRLWFSCYNERLSMSWSFECHLGYHSRHHHHCTSFHFREHMILLCFVIVLWRALNITKL
jgi:hypothetical protein